MKPWAIAAAIVFATCGGFISIVYAAEADALQFVQPDMQLGALTNGQDVSVTFVLTNRSDKVVKIVSVDASCHCTSVEKSPDEIPAHGSGTVVVNFNSSRSDGPVTQSAVVETADAQILTGQFSAMVGSMPAAAVIAPWIPDRGDGTYQNPVLFADYSDPDAARVGDDFYLVSSSFHATPGLPILHSKDLVNWTIIGHALAAQPPVDHFSVPRHGEGVWAPAIRFHDGKFWIFYPDPDYGIYFTTATNPAGEWTPPQLVKAGKGLIDPCPFWDDDGQFYLIHGWARSRAGIANLLTLNKLSFDAIKVLDAGEVIIDGNKLTNWTTLEGPKLYKRHGFYYVFAPSGGVTGGYQAVFRATNIYGPYEHRIVLDQGKTAINGPHQGAWVDTLAGENWFLHFQDRGAYGRVVHLEPMIWHDDWPVIGDDPDHTGTGQPVLVHAKPNVGKTYPITAPQTSDEFDGATLGLQWQWNANPQNDWVSFSARPGFLRLASVPTPKTRTGRKPAVKNLYDAPNFLLQKFPATEFTVTTELQFAPAAEDEFAGLTIFGYDYALLGLRKTADGLRLVYVVNSGANRGAEEHEVVGVDTTNSTVYLRVTVGSGAMCRFAYSFDNQTFTPIGEPFKASGDRWIGAKVGIIAGAPSIATNTGYADFDWFHVTPAIP
jgi:beta-xylosidase